MAAKSIAIALPIPLEAPVITTFIVKFYQISWHILNCPYAFSPLENTGNCFTISFVKVTHTG